MISAGSRLTDFPITIYCKQNHVHKTVTATVLLVAP